MKGVSSLGLCHPKYPVGSLVRCLRSSRDVVAVRWLDMFFNPKNSTNATRLLQKLGPKVGLIMPHIINGPGINNGRVQKFEITYGYNHKSLEAVIQSGGGGFIKKFSARVDHVAKTIRDSGNLAPIYICPWLERQPIKESTFQALANVIRRRIPNAIIVDSALSGPMYGDKTEKHGDTSAPADIHDLDGTDWQTIDFLNWSIQRRGKIAFIWGLVENGNPNKDKDENGKPIPWQPPERRTNWPTEREFKMYSYWLNDDIGQLPMLNPLDSQGLKLLPTKDGKKKGFTWKLGDGRKVATLLLPAGTKRPKSLVITKDGKRVDTGTYSGLYTHDKSNRLIYRFTKHPVEIPEMSVVRADKIGWILERPAYRED